MRQARVAVDVTDTGVRPGWRTALPVRRPVVITLLRSLTSCLVLPTRASRDRLSALGTIVPGTTGSRSPAGGGGALDQGCFTDT